MIFRLILLCTITTCLMGAEVNSFLEKFALGNRAEALKELIPGTADYYFYHALDAQHRRDTPQFEALIKDWSKQFRHDSQRDKLLLRQAVLNYDKDPKGSIAYLTDKLGIRFHHQAPDSSRQNQLPTDLDQNLISYQAFLKEALRSNKYNTNGYENHHLCFVNAAAFPVNVLRDYLRKLPFPHAPGLIDQIVRELNDRHSRGFGSLPIHNKLLASQLAELQRRRPALIGKDNFIRARLNHLQPRDGSDWRINPVSYGAYLKGVWDFVSTLPASQNSLKANILHHVLVHNRTQGVFNQKLFEQYLAYPRSAVYVNRDYTKRFKRDHVNFRANYQKQTSLPPIGRDEALVRAYLEHFFSNGAKADAFNTYIEKKYADAIYAETMVLAGKGDQEQWASWLGAERYRAIQERTELIFGAQNKTRFHIGEKVNLDLHVKNVEKLLVRVYPINTEAWYRDKHTEIPMSFDVDGLVTDLEQRLAYTTHPARRHLEQIKLDAINKRGVYIVECIGNGNRCRSVIRIGDLHVRERIGTAGHVLHVYNEEYSLVKDAVIHLGNQQFKADKDGSFLIPFATNAGSKQLVVAQNEFAIMHRLNHKEESYTLDIQTHVNRQDALAGQLTQLVLRPQLFLHGDPVNLNDLENISVHINARTIDGIDAKEVIENITLNEVDAWTHDIRFPDRVTNLEIVVRAEIEQVSTGNRQQLHARTQTSFNGMLSEQRFKDIFLRKQQDGYVLDVLGRNGESYPDKEVVSFTFKHRDFTKTIYKQFRTDKSGTIKLGALTDITNIRANYNGSERAWDLDQHSFRCANEYHLRTSDVLRLAWTNADDAIKAARLYSLRNNVWSQDHSKSLSLNKHGQLEIAALAAGDYKLFLPSVSRPIHLSVEEALRKDGQLFGAARIMNDTVPNGLHLGQIQKDAKNIRIPVVGASAATRVHIAISRYMVNTHLMDYLGRVSLRSQDVYSPALATNDFLGMRRLSDEHRYILDREYQDVFPTLSLQRPALLLHPWERAATQTGHVEGGAGDGAFGSRMGGGKKRSVGRNGGSVALESSHIPNYDFLKFGAIILANAGVDKDGFITVPRELISDQSHLQVLACEPEQSVMRSFGLDEQALQRRERRFMPKVSSNDTFRQDKRISSVRAGDSLALDLDPNAWRVMDTFGQAFDLLDTLCSDSRLADFQFIKRWPSLKAEEKDRYYSLHACHELNVFIYHKDQVFFNKVIKSSLANKHDKTFIDYYLLESNLSQYTSEWHFARLNVFERALLLKRLKEQKDPILRSMNESLALIIPDQRKRDHLFNTALRGKSLDQQKIAQLQKAGNKTMLPAMAKEKMQRLRARKAEAKVMELEEDLEMADEDAALMPAEPAKADKGGYFAKDRKKNAGRARRLYRQVDQTKEWAENNYYKRYPHEQLADLITHNDYWLAYASHQDGAFLSHHIAQAHSNASEVLMALAVLDLPFSAEKHDIVIDGQKQSLTAKSPSIVYYIDIVKEPFQKEDAAVTVTQQLYRVQDRYRYEDGEQIERFIKGDVLFRDVYGSQIVITNPTARPRHIDLLLQIPQGAIAISGHHASHNSAVRIGSYSVKRFDILFYFPEAGAYELQPATVSSKNNIIGRADARTLTVSTSLPDMDRGSWQYIADFGSNEQVIAYLASNNVKRLDLERIAFRMQEQAMFEQVITALGKAKVFVPVLWSYGFKFNNPAAMSTWLKHNQRIVDSCGAYIKSPLLNIDAVEHLRYEHLEYYPLINARSHSFAGKRHITNASLSNQYTTFLNTLRYLPTLRQRDQFIAVIYLLSQDRIADSLAHFKSIDEKAIHQKLQYDYCLAYLALMEDDIKTATRISQSYLDYGVKHWRQRFVTMHNQLLEIENKQQDIVTDPNREQDMEQRAAREAMLDIETQGHSVTIHHRNINTASVKLYRMNLELLFSRNPFMKGEAGQFAYIAANHHETIKLDPKQDKSVYTLPDDYRKGNVLVEVQSAGIRRRSVLFVHQLHLLTQDNYGQLQVRHRDSAKQVTKAYVKVYAKMSDGQIKFYKDGYTDYRGRFDYAALSTNDLDNVQQFALFVAHPEHGALVREVNPPQR